MYWGKNNILAKPVKAGDAKLLGPLTWQPVAHLFDSSDMATEAILVNFFVADSLTNSLEKRGKVIMKRVIFIIILLIGIMFCSLISFT
jgi:hypothetical protein